MSIGKNAGVFRFSFPLMIALLLVMWGLWTNVVIPHTSMHPDESWTYDYMEAAQSPVELVQILTADTHPPMWWIIFYTWYHATGGSEFTGRWIAAFFGLLAMAFVYKLGRDWFHDTRYGLFAVMLLMVSAPFVWLGVEIRPYSLLFFLACYSMFAFRRWLHQQTWRSAAFYAVACAMLMYIHYYLAFLIAAQLLYWLISRPSRRLIQQGVGVGVLAFLIWLPWFPTFVRQVTLLRSITPSEQGGIGFIPTTSVTSPATILDLLSKVGSGSPWLPVVLLMLGAALLWRKTAYRLLLTWAIVPVTLVLLINLRVEVFTLRYVSYGLVGMVVAGGMALAALPRRISWMVTLVVVALMAYGMPAEMPVHPPFRDILGWLVSEHRPDDLIYLDFLDNNERHLRRQLIMYLPDALRETAVGELPEHPTAKRIWYLTNNLFDAEKQAHFQALNDGSRVVKLSRGNCDAVYCLVAQLLESAPLDKPVIFGDNIAFYGSDIEFPAPEQLQATLWWRFDTPPDFDYSIGVFLLNAAGQVVGQSDGAIHNYYGGQDVPLTTAELNHYYLDVRTFNLPPDLPRDTAYTLAVTVYDWRDNHRLPVSGGTSTDNLLNVQTVNLPEK